MKKVFMRKVVLALITLLLVVNFSNIALGQTYCQTQITNVNHHGLKGDFKIPTTTSGYVAGSANKINLEEWLFVDDGSGYYAWVELGYKNGQININGTNEYYNGFFRAKQINGVFVAEKLNKSYTLGTTYTFTIVDSVDNSHLYETYVGSTYFGAFSSNPNYSNSGLTDQQGFEIGNTTQANQSISSTIVDNQYYFARDTDDYDHDGNTTEIIWKKWNNKTVSIYDDTGLVNLSYSTTNNTSTYTQQ